MSNERTIVETTPELVAAVSDPNVRVIAVRDFLEDVPTLRLHPDVTLCAEGDAGLIFEDGLDGLQLTTRNTVRDLQLVASPDRRAIFNDTSCRSLGRLHLAHLTTIGQVQILAKDKLVHGHVEVEELDIQAADTRSRQERPQNFGVEVLQGAFTLWNVQPDQNVRITANLSGLSVGRPSAPVIGSGIFLCGGGSQGGTIHASLLKTYEIHSDGQIEGGTSDLITGGIFVVYSAYVDVVRNIGPVTTYGVNDMVLDNWGHVNRWIAESKISSFGACAMAFVNFGNLHELQINDLVETFGEGARGCTALAGSIDLATFDRIVTHQGGATGVLIQQPIGRMLIRRGIETFGGMGKTLVRGEFVELPAVGLIVGDDGLAQEIEVHHGIRTNIACIQPIEMRGMIGSLNVQGGLKAPSGCEKNRREP